ncbi:MAG: phenylalanine--tRNA ligase subunit alpha [Nitrososphaerota archaeon]
MAKPKLHWLEKLILRALIDSGRPMEYGEVADAISKDEGAVAKASLWLKEKDLVEVKEVSVKVAKLGTVGRDYLKNGLPERRLIHVLKKVGGRTSIDELEKERSLGGELAVAIMWAKKKGWITVEDSDSSKIVRIVDEVPDVTPEEELLEYLGKGDVRVDALSPKLLDACLELSGRPKVVELYEERRHIMIPTELVRSIPLEELEVERPVVTKLTPELLITGKWRNFELSPFDINAPTKPIFAAKRHPLVTLIKLIKDTFVELGFDEIKGPLVELAFWNFDALFQPQDHPAREMHDTFYLAYPGIGKLPERFVESVRKSHEFGGDTGSRGWRYKWSRQEASKLILRTHTTATTIRHLAYNNEPPIKVFSVDRIYRNEKVDWKHLAEFHQVEGIIMDKKATFRELMGLIKEFCNRIGLKEITFRPSYFPYTEPSAEVIVYMPEKHEWLELFGMGIFRPEVTVPLGVKHPVLAWGGGLERLAMALFKLDDIRTLYANDLNWIRGMPRVYVDLKSGRL